VQFHRSYSPHPTHLDGGAESGAGTGRWVKRAFRQAAAAAPTPRLVEMEADNELASTAANMYDLLGLMTLLSFRLGCDRRRHGEESDTRR